MLYVSPSGRKVQASAEMADQLRHAGYTPADELETPKPKARRAPRKKPESSEE